MSANYKDTLLLPKTDFPMKADLVKREPERLAKWEAAGLYRQILDARIGAPLFVLHDGPPFANGDVHMGTALNKILKDLVVKSRSMLGFRAPFVPGWDCHGLPIEFKVVKEQRGLEPAEIRRRAEAFARKYIDIQRAQFKRLGVFGSWEEPYLTLAPGYEADIIRAFGKLVEKGLVYQSKKPVYWSTGAQTALAEAEVEYEVRDDPAIYVKFRLTAESEQLVAKHLGRKGPTYFLIWTTTPWTLPANVAVAFNPGMDYFIVERGHEFYIVARTVNFAPIIGPVTKREEGSHYTMSVPSELLLQLSYSHPFLARTGVAIAADFVTTETGTGLVHIAPGHGKDDYIAGQKNGLPVLSPVDDHGRFTQLEEGFGEIPETWVGKDVFKANDDVIALLKEKGALMALQKHTHLQPVDLYAVAPSDNFKPENYRHDYPHCWRSKTPIVFRAVEQFFIRIDAFRAEALAAVDSVNWIPQWARNRIYGTVESRPDWCISRQRTWGVPLPVFYEENGTLAGSKGTPIVRADLAAKVADLVESGGTNLWFEKDDAWWAAQLGLPAGTSRRNDTLDVWIDSGVSHQAVTSRHPELKACGGVADVYLEATDQHRGWFQSSLMTSVALTGHAPYKTVITHGFVVDKDTKKKVSKSDQGTYKKPMEAEYFVNKYGADIVRLWASSVEFTSEVPFSEESFAVLTDAYRSFRNILRILLANLSGFESGNQESRNLDGATDIDRWVLSRLQNVIATCREAYAAYDFRKVFQTLNQFVAVDISALYVDITKDRLYCDAADSPRRRATQAVMARVFDALTRLLAPVLAFTADEAWEFFGKKTSVHLESFPEADSALIDKMLEERIQKLLDLRAVIAQAIEPARQAKQIGNALEASVTLQLADGTLLKSLAGSEGELEEFFIVSELKLADGPEDKAGVEPVKHKKCARCWRHRPTVSVSAAHPDLCERCGKVVAK